MKETENRVGFDTLPLGPTLQKTLKQVGYLNATPIQAAFIPKAIEGGDVIGQAQTGTGKTASFLLPVLERIEPTPRPQALILGPTRELVQQVYEEALRLSADTDVKIAVVYGGQHLGKQIRQLQEGVQVIIGTPGRILDLMHRRCLITDHIRFVVLDEADRMLDIGFRPDIEKILRKTPDSRQTLLLSATMPPPVQRLAKRYMRDPQIINLSTDEVSVESIDQAYFTVDEDRKLALLLQLLVREKPRQCLIFCQMKTGVRRVANELGRRFRGVMAMRGDLPQTQRNRVMKLFREGKIRVLVATDVVGRGIDVSEISHVINYDIPEDPEAYVHRIGRTGRMGKVGKAYTFVTQEQGELLTAIEMYMNKQLRADRIEGFQAFRPQRKKTATL